MASDSLAADEQILACISFVTSHP
ncbi:hypothetical protein EMIT0373P_30820 [Pseudomonas chlororaphis]